MHNEERPTISISEAYWRAEFEISPGHPALLRNHREPVPLLDDESSEHSEDDIQRPMPLPDDAPSKHSSATARRSRLKGPDVPDQVSGAWLDDESSDNSSETKDDSEYRDELNEYLSESIRQFCNALFTSFPKNLY